MDEQASSNWRVVTGRRLRPWLSAIPWLIGALALGAWLGVGIGQGFRFRVQDAPFGGLVESLLVVVAVGTLGLWAAIRRNWRPAIALAGLVASCLVGYHVAPEPVGAWNQGPGTAVIGTLTDPDAHWSGGVSCSWQHGDPTVSWVGFGRPEPVAPARLIDPLDGADLDGLLLSGSALGRAVITWTQGEPAVSYYKWRAEVAVLEFADNGQTGTVDLGVDGLVISWACEEGP